MPPLPTTTHQHTLKSKTFFFKSSYISSENGLRDRMLQNLCMFVEKCSGFVTLQFARYKC